ncbi:DUF2407 C-terminal domain-containing protein [Radiomyces spectabilis]|uniref:DUF2407 C-terminal domain-containing protein n=1 Tax=Radiomyces spectabilis TaxID=64574 RepID=UPI00221E9315|nr:DUF2407 C-terminal domain-containing protein [Radiomyces spectabilis]KAI8368258.1 DUF2407 C-terminal domain-containing protein [Radiomyces spectabilis]
MAESNMDHYESIDVHIRWTEGQDLVFRLSPATDTIADIKQKIRQSAPHTSNKKIRLIHNGRILEDASTLLDYGLGKIISNSSSKAKIPPPSPVYIHCSISDYITSERDNNRPQLTIPSGFDRLRESGFNEEEIQSIRTQFHRMHGTEFNGESTEETRRLEEQWMDNTGDTLPDGTIQGTYKEMMWGLMLGFFLGVLCLFWFRESVFTRRHQMGILAGMLINISFGVLHVYY